jgi:hypothetical protein
MSIPGSNEVSVKAQRQGCQDRARARGKWPKKAIREADRAEAEAWSIRGMAGQRSRRRRSRNASMADNAGAIVATNLLLGWTFIGWVVALIWSLTSVQLQPGAVPGPPDDPSKFTSYHIGLVVVLVLGALIALMVKNGTIQ